MFAIYYDSEMIKPVYKESLLIVGPTLLGCKYIKKACDHLQLNPIIFYSQGDAKKFLSRVQSYQIDITSKSKIIALIDSIYLKFNIKYILTMFDELMPIVIEINNIYNFIGPDEVLKNLAHKDFQYKLAKELSPPSLLLSKKNKINISLIERFISDNPTNLILKPSLSAGAINQHIFYHKVLSKEIIKTIVNDTQHNTWILQPELNGELVSLEGFVKNSLVTTIGFSKRMRYKFSEMTNYFPVDRILSSSIAKQCKYIVTHIVSSSHMTNGYFHCEFILTDNKPYLIDGNFGRVAGGAILEQIALAYNTSSEHILAHVISTSLKDYDKVNIVYGIMNDKDLVNNISVGYCLEEEATLLSIKLDNQKSVKHTVLIAEGSSFPPAGLSHKSRIGFLTGVEDDVIEALSRLSINTDKGIRKPFYVLPKLKDSCFERKK